MQLDNLKEKTGEYGIKAYGSWTCFTGANAKTEFTEYLMDWIAGTDGSERDRAVDALTNVRSGHNFTNTDAA